MRSEADHPAPTVLHALSRAGDAVGVSLVHDRTSTEYIVYTELYRRVRVAAAALREGGVRRGERVLFLLPTGHQFFIGFFALQLIGAVPVPATPPAGVEKVGVAMQRLCHIAAHAGIAFALTSHSLCVVVEGIASTVPSLRRVFSEAILTSYEGPLPDGASELEQVSPDALAFLQYTSGSTGNPKGAAITHAQLAANVGSFGERLGITRHDVVVSWLPLYHDMGLIGVLCGATYLGIGQVLLSPLLFLLHPRRWLEVVAEHRATVIVAPNFGYAHATKRVRGDARAGLDLSSVRVALMGAEPVNLATVESFCDAFAGAGFAAAAVRPAYGLAEATLAVTMSPASRPLRARRVDRAALSEGHVVDASDEVRSTVIASSGTPLRDTSLRILGEGGEGLGEHCVGHIVVRSPSVMVGYFDDAARTAEVIRDGWLWTGDLGFLDDGELFVTGRVKDLIILQGKNYYAEDVERVAERVGATPPGGAIAFGVYDEGGAKDLVVLIAETPMKDEAGRELLATTLSEAVAAECGIVLREVLLVPPRTLPRTSSGKKQRLLTKERYLAGALR